MTQRSSYRFNAALVDPSQRRERYRASTSRYTKSPPPRCSRARRIATAAVRPPSANGARSR